MAKRSDPKHLHDLKPDPQNARLHNDRNIGMIADSLREVGAARSIVIDENNIVRAGNGTLLGAAHAGITKVKVIDADGRTLIAVRRTGLTEDQKRRLSLLDNRAAELAEWDPDVLRALAEAGTPLDGIFSQDELAALTQQDEPATVEGMKVDRPTDVVWVLAAIPMHSWPQNQAAVESLQNASVFSTMVLRPKEPEKKGKSG